MRLPAKLPGGRVFGLRFLPCRKARASALPPAIFVRELHDTIDSATMSLRESGQDGPRVMVIADPLGGAFIYSRQDAELRIRKGFPELPDASVMRGVRHLETRARVVALPPPRELRRASWVHGWMED